jgi:hypothetical protein
MVINQLFLSTDPTSFTPPEIGAVSYLFDIPQLREFVHNTIDNYNNLPNLDNKQLDIIEPLKNSTGQFEPIMMYIFFHNDTLSESIVL